MGVWVDGSIGGRTDGQRDEPMVPTGFIFSYGMIITSYQGSPAAANVGRKLRISQYFFYLDTNECLQNSTCHPNAKCNNTEGSYVCMCNTGYDGDGFTCNGKKT